MYCVSYWYVIAGLIVGGFVGAVLMDACHKRALTNADAEINRLRYLVKLSNRKK